MDKKTQAQTNKVRSNYDALAQAYAREIAGELDHRPLERDLLQRFAKECNGLIYDLGCVPGHVARYASGFNPGVFGVDLSPGCCGKRVPTILKSFFSLVICWSFHWHRGRWLASSRSTRSFISMKSRYYKH